MSAAYTYTRQGRSRTTAVVVLAIWTAIVSAWALLDMAPWLVALVGLCTLPAMWDHYTNPLSGLTLEDGNILWFSGKRRGAVAFDEIDHVRLDTRLDFSVRATLVLKTGAKLRLPFEATPPHEAFEQALNARGLATKRFHFQLFQ
ncbi:hypothetical protein [Sulfitobacter geojensis]|uniref:hypothetical protein n=1 Tax=Sulfitobacter geojensis TaxID=1342299 RepID=UPI000A8BDE37|nr:hypothetical protein [Sulfitobacter geojensis]